VTEPRRRVGGAQLRGSGEAEFDEPHTGIEAAAAQFVATSTSNVGTDALGAPEGRATTAASGR
jgi:hypothetical protein